MMVVRNDNDVLKTYSQDDFRPCCLEIEIQIFDQVKCELFRRGVGCFSDLTDQNH